MADYNNQYLTLVAKGSGNIQFEVTSGQTYYYSTNNGSSWNSATSATTIAVNNGDRVMMKGELVPNTSSWQGIGSFSSTTAQFELEGNPMSLLFGNNFSGQTSLSGKNLAICDLFYGCKTLTSIQNLKLPATTLSIDCYAAMFSGCTALTAIPDGLLPATTLAEMCYTNMFQDCTSLTTVPTDLLPATTLSNTCYRYMFSRCTSLEKAPKLLAETLTTSAYYGMFSGCTMLNEITCYATDISANQCTRNWVVGVASNGTFYKSAEMEDWSRSTSGIPVNWNVEDYNPTQYRWTATTGYECSGTTKMTREKKQQSTDGGSTWSDVSPLETRAALPVIEYYSTDCGYVPLERWVTVSGAYSCSGTTKMTQEKKQVSYDSGSTWSDVSPLETRAALPVIEYDSMDCGFVPEPIYKWERITPVSGDPNTYVCDSCNAHNYLTFVAKENCKFAIYNRYSNDKTYYSLDDGETWNLIPNASYTDLTGGTIPQSAYTPTIAGGQKILWKCNISSNSSNCIFTSVGRFSAGGNAMSMNWGDNFEGQTRLKGEEDFSTMFMWCSGLTNIDDLELPATENVYYGGSSSGVVQRGMFKGCTSLTRIPRGLLSANLNLKAHCYQDMFAGCTSLTSIPSDLLPATTMNTYCYASMFASCTSLTTVPTNLLPATVLTATTEFSGMSCYEGMFMGCTALTKAPELPATTLANQCYQAMFAGCTSLQKAPTLSASTLAPYCYAGMFTGCTSLNEITCLATDISAEGCVGGWVYNVAPSGFFRAKDGVEYEVDSASGIPVGWTRICETCMNPIYRWVVVSDGYECSGVTKMTQEKKQVSWNSGVTWNDAAPLETRAALPVIETLSQDCYTWDSFSIVKTSCNTARCLAPQSPYGQRYSLSGSNGYYQTFSMQCTALYDTAVFSNVQGIILNFDSVLCHIGESAEFTTEDGITYRLSSKRGNDNHDEGCLIFKPPYY